MGGFALNPRLNESRYFEGRATHEQSLQVLAIAVVGQAIADNRKLTREDIISGRKVDRQKLNARRKTAPTNDVYGVLFWAEHLPEFFSSEDFLDYCELGNLDPTNAAISAQPERAERFAKTRSNRKKFLNRRAYRRQTV